jgi:hypothetical protein
MQSDGVDRWLATNQHEYHVFPQPLLNLKVLIIFILPKFCSQYCVIKYIQKET